MQKKIKKSPKTHVFTPFSDTNPSTPCFLWVLDLYRLHPLRKQGLADFDNIKKSIYIILILYINLA